MTRPAAPNPRRQIFTGGVVRSVLKGFHHVVLFCKDTAASRDWYARVGFEYLRGYHGMHWFRLGPSEIMLHPADSPSGGPGPVLHAAVANVDELFRRVVEAGFTPVDHQQGGRPIAASITHAGGAREFELRDPDGHNWAFTQA